MIDDRGLFCRIGFNNGQNDLSGLRCEVFAVGNTGAFSMASNLYTLDIISAKTSTFPSTTATFDIVWTLNIPYGSWDTAWNTTLLASPTF